MALVMSTKVIASTPEHVRRVLLDFDAIPQWTQGFIRSIQPVEKKDRPLEKGDKLHVALEGTSFSPIVLENSARQFQWRGSIPLLFYGDHTFRFEPGPTPNTTLFTHSEQFSGPLAFIVKFLPTGSKQLEGFEGFNEDLRKKVESELD